MGERPGSQTPGTPARQSPPLVGRAAELRTLRLTLEQAARGTRRVAIVEGAPGIGKTRLVQEALREADGLGFIVFRGAAEELEQGRPFAALAEALRCRPGEDDEDRAEIARLLSGGARLPEVPATASSAVHMALAPQAQFRVLEAFTALMERIALDRPVALAIEDLHWADVGTLLGLRFVERRLEGLPVCLIATARPSPRSVEVERFVERSIAGGAANVTLEPLDRTAVDDLISETLGAQPGPHLAEQATGAGGNPLFVIELVRALADEGSVVVRDGVAEIPEGISLPLAFRATILRRLRTLSDTTLEALRVASVLGSSFSIGDLAMLSGHAPAALVGAIDEAIGAGIVGDEEGRLAFRHDLIRDAIYESLPAPVRAEMHHAAGRALAERGAPPAHAARHLALGTTPGEAVDWLARAARESAPHAPGVAVELLQQALGLLEPADPARDALAAHLLVPLVWSGRVTDGERVARDALGRAVDPASRGVLRLGLAQALTLQGRPLEAAEQLELEASEPEVPARVRALMFSEASLGRLLSGDFARAVDEANEARRLGESLGDDLPVCLALSTLAWASALRGDVADGIAFAVEAVERAGRSASPEARGISRPSFFLGVALLAGDRLDEAHRTLERARAMTEEQGIVADLPTLHWGLAAGHFLAGRWDDAVAVCEAGLALVDEVGVRLGVAWPSAILALVAHHRDDARTATGVLAAAERDSATSGIQFGLDWLMWARALLEESRDPGRAAQILDMAFEVDRALGLATMLPLPGPDLVRMHLSLGNADRAGAVTEAVEDAAARVGTPAASGAALLCRGLLDADTTLLLRALEAYRAGPRRLDLALACEQAGARAKDAALVEEALGIFEQLGAVRDARRAAASLRALGVRRSVRPVSRPSAGWESLTETEGEVARLAATGLTNPDIAGRLFISRGTVKAHLSHVFGKLGISSRVELAAIAARRAESGVP